MQQLMQNNFVNQMNHGLIILVRFLQVNDRDEEMSRVIHPTCTNVMSNFLSASCVYLHFVIIFVNFESLFECDGH